MGMPLSNYCKLILGGVIDIKKLNSVIHNSFVASEKLVKIINREFKEY